MINEAFDDDATEPEGDFSRTIGGRQIWFNNAKPGQISAFRRLQGSMKTRFDKIRDDNSLSDLEKLEKLQDMSDRFDSLTLDLVESLLVNEDDADFIASGMIRGEIGVGDVLRVLFVGDDEPEDDAEPVAKPRKAVKSARVGTVKKTANVKRTRR